MLLTIFVKAFSVWLGFISLNLNKTSIIELSNYNTISSKMLAEKDSTYILLSFFPDLKLHNGFFSEENEIASPLESKHRFPL